MKKRILSILLTLVMVIGMLPTVAFAAGEVTEVDTFEELYDAVSTGKTNIKLTENIDYTCPADVAPAAVLLNFNSGETVLDLNNKTLSFRTGGNASFTKLTSFINVSGTSELTIENGTVSYNNGKATDRDSRGTIKVTDSAKLVTENVDVLVASTHGDAIYADSSAIVHLKDGLIQTNGDYALHCRGGVSVTLDNGVHLRTASHTGAPTSGSARGYGSLCMEALTAGASLDINYAIFSDGVTIENKTIIESAFDISTHDITINTEEVDQPIWVGLNVDLDKNQYFDDAYWYNKRHLVQTSSGAEYALNVVVKSKSYVEPSVTSVVVSPASATVDQGTSKQFTATVTVNAGASKEVTWIVEGNNSAFTTINSEGVLTVGADETATNLYVTATSVVDTTKYAIASVAVNKTGSGEGGDVVAPIVGKVQDITVSGTEGTALSVENVTIDIYRDGDGPAYYYVSTETAVGTDVTGWFKNLPAGLTATVNSYSSGRLIITIAGEPEETSSEVMKIVIPKAAVEGTETDITVTENANAKYAIAEGDDTPAPTPTVSIPETLALKVGESSTLTATGDYEGYTLSWSSDNEAVATVDENGKVTAVAAGTANITVTLDAGATRTTISDTCVVTVTKAEPEVETYTVYFFLDKNDEFATSFDDVEAGQTATAPEDPAPEGKTFLGWYTSDDIKFDFSTPINSNLNLYAKFGDPEEPELEPVVIEIPVSKKVINGGNVAFAGEETFEFIVEILNSNVEEYDVEGNFIKVTNGEGGSTTIVITVPGELYDDLCSEGLRITEAVGETEGWTYSEESYFVMVSPNGQRYMLEGEAENTAVESIVFTNTYTENKTEDPTKPTYGIVVNNGKSYTGAGVEISAAEEGTKITIKANEAPEGKEFDKWVVNNGTITLADATKAETTFDMPAERVQVTATYKDKVVTPPADDNDDNKDDANKPSDDKEDDKKPATDTESPKTGDTSNIFMWFAVLFVSGFALVGFTLFGRKRRA